MSIIPSLLIAPKEVIREYILDLIPDKVRKIIGTILLIFGTVVILCAMIVDFDSYTGIVGLIAIFVGMVRRLGFRTRRNWGSYCSFSRFKFNHFGLNFSDT